MATMGKVRYPEEVRHLRTEDNSGESERLARQAMLWTPTRATGKTTEESLKEKHDYLKDAYVFMKSNKDNLNDPQVKEILSNMLAGAGVSPVFKRKEVPTMSGQQLTGGVEGAVAGPGAGREGELEGDVDKTIHSLYQRFMMENPNVYKPETTEEMYEGTPSTVRRDPISGEVSAFGQIPKGYAPGTQIGEMVGEKFKVRHTVPTAKETKVESKWNITKQDDGGWRIEDTTGTGKPTITYPPGTAKDVEKEDMKWAVKNAAVDMDSLERETHWYGDESDEDFEARKKIYLQERIGFYLSQLKQGSPTSPQSPQQPPTEITATNPTTGEKVKWDGKQWVPVK